MEKSEKVFVYPASFGWSDLGTWGSLYSRMQLDKDQNSVQGDSVNLYQCTDNIIRFSDGKLVVIQGLNGYETYSFYIRSKLDNAGKRYWIASRSGRLDQ